MTSDIRKNHKEGAECRVYGMQVDEQRAAGKSEYQGETYYFCWASCKQQFDQNPERYTGQGTTSR
jgi:YHS domain-containing protein